MQLILYNDLIYSLNIFIICISSSSFFVDSLKFSTQRIMSSANKYNFYFFFFSSSVLVFPVSYCSRCTSSTILNRNLTLKYYTTFHVRTIWQYTSISFLKILCYFSCKFYSYMFQSHIHYVVTKFF